MKISKEKTKKKNKEILKEYDSNKWREELGSKNSVNIYYSRKKKIKEERIYDNRWCSVLLFRSRANILDLHDRKRFPNGVQGDTSYRLCKCEYEDLKHFLINCKKLEEERNPRLMGKSKGGNDDITVGNILFDIDDEDLEDTKKMLTIMWNRRKKLEQEGKKEKGIEEKPRKGKKTEKKRKNSGKNS